LGSPFLCPAGCSSFSKKPLLYCLSSPPPHCSKHPNCLPAVLGCHFFWEMGRSPSDLSTKCKIFSFLSLSGLLPANLAWFFRYPPLSREGFFRMFFHTRWNVLVPPPSSSLHRGDHQGPSDPGGGVSEAFFCLRSSFSYTERRYIAFRRFSLLMGGNKKARWIFSRGLVKFVIFYFTVVCYGQRSRELFPLWYSFFFLKRDFPDEFLAGVGGSFCGLLLSGRGSLPEPLLS